MAASAAARTSVPGAPERAMTSIIRPPPSTESTVTSTVNPTPERGADGPARAAAGMEGRLTERPPRSAYSERRDRRHHPRGRDPRGGHRCRADPDRAGRDRAGARARGDAPHRAARPVGARCLGGVHAPGLGRPRARPPAARRGAVRRDASPAAHRDVPRGASGAACGRLQGARLRHRLPLPRRHRPHLLLRQPDLRRGAGARGRRRGALRPTAVLARRPTSSSATGSTASCGPGVVRRWQR